MTYLHGGCAQPDPAELERYWQRAGAELRQANLAAEYEPRWIGLDAATTEEVIELIRSGDKVGTLEVGKRADIIVTDRSPLQATSNVIHMFINGKPIDIDDNLHTELYKKYGRRVKKKETSQESID